MNIQSLANPVRSASSCFLDVVFHQPSSPWVPVGVYLPVAAAGVVWNLLDARPAAWMLVGLPLAGLLVWTLVEYVFHAAGFHWPARSAQLQALRASHWSHHEVPKDPTRIITRLSFTMPLALIFWALFAAVLRSWELAALPLAGLIVGYLSYEVIHFGIHCWRRGHWLFRPLVRHHLYHHYKDPTRCFGVTTGLWDWVFRTGRPGSR
jgi:hypothetical protein